MVNAEGVAAAGPQLSLTQLRHGVAASHYFALPDLAARIGSSPMQTRNSATRHPAITNQGRTPTLQAITAQEASRAK
jgi:hypothetical protein